MENHSHNAAQLAPRLVPLTVLAGGRELDHLVEQLTVPGFRVLAPGPADVASRTPGCPCCAVRLDLVDAIERAVLRRRRPEHVVLTVDLDDPAGADVVTAVYTVLSDPDIARLVRLDGVAVSVDPVALATRSAVGASLLRHAEVEALAMADRVLVARADAVTGDAAALVDTVLRTTSPYGAILAPALRPVHRPDVFGIDAWHGVPRHRSGAPIELDGVSMPSTVVLRHRGAVDPDAADEFFDRLVTGTARRLIRFQGVIAARGNRVRTCCHGVRSFAMSHPAAEDASGGPGAQDNLVVVTAWDLDVNELLEDFREATA